jgi:hypothetical protein
MRASAAGSRSRGAAVRHTSVLKLGRVRERAGSVKMYPVCILVVRIDRL